MKKIIGILLTLTMLFGMCPSMLAKYEDVTRFDPIELTAGRMVVDGNNVKLVLTADFSFGDGVTADSFIGTKIKGTFNCNDGTIVSVDAVVTGTGTATDGKTTLLFAKPDGLPETNNYGTANLKLYPADKITKYNCVEQNTPIAIARHGQGKTTNGGTASRITLVSSVNSFPFEVTSENIKILNGCLVSGTITNGEDKSVTFINSPIEACEISGNEVKFQPAAINGAGYAAIGAYSSGTTKYDLTISPAPYDADVYASYVAAEGTAAAAQPFDKPHVVNNGSISGVVNTGADRNTISTGFIKEVSAAPSGTQHWEVTLPASGSYVKLSEDDSNELTTWISMNLGDAVVQGSDGDIYPIESFTVSEEDKDYITWEFDRAASSTTITTDDVTTVLCGLIIENIYAPGASAAVE